MQIYFVATYRKLIEKLRFKVINTKAANFIYFLYLPVVCKNIKTFSYNLAGHTFATSKYVDAIILYLSSFFGWKLVFFKFQF